MAIQSIRQSIIDMEYGWNVQSLHVLIPGISLIYQKIQVSHLMGILRNTYQRPEQFLDLYRSREYAQLDVIYKWHVIGSSIQSIICAGLAAIHPIFLIPLISAVYEMILSSNGLTHEVILLTDGHPPHIER